MAKSMTQQIWDDHLGNNAFTKHRDACPLCQEVVKRFQVNPTMNPTYCPEGERIFEKMLDEICDQMDEAQINQN